MIPCSFWGAWLQTGVSCSQALPCGFLFLCKELTHFGKQPRIYRILEYLATSQADLNVYPSLLWKRLQGDFLPIVCYFLNTQTLKINNWPSASLWKAYGCPNRNLTRHKGKHHEKSCPSQRTLAEPSAGLARPHDVSLPTHRQHARLLAHLRPL